MKHDEFIDKLKEVSIIETNDGITKVTNLKPIISTCECGKETIDRRVTFTQSIVQEKVCFVERCNQCNCFKNPFSKHFNLRGHEWSVAFSAYVLGQDNPYKSRDKKRELKAK